MSKQLERFKFVVVDADGTIFDTMGAYANYFAKLLNQKFGVNKGQAVEDFLLTAGTSVDNQFRQIFEKEGISVAQNDINALVTDMYSYAETLSVPLFDDTNIFLNWLKENGKICFLTSGTPTSVLEKRLGDIDFLDLFTLVLGSDKVPKGIEHFKIFAQTQKVSLEKFASTACMIGDGPNDMKYAKEAKITAIGLLRKPKGNIGRERIMREAGADKIIVSLKELLI